ncbi:hypothetical protein WALBB_100010 [Wolbachia pipientis wAlbB]|nr:hypothetical protein WALBB_100010 [Wolbachia pipientis wAlbB]
MLEKGANPNIINDDGKKPRNVAVLRSRHNKDKPYDQIFNHYGLKSIVIEC